MKLDKIYLEHLKCDLRVKDTISIEHGYRNPYPVIYIDDHPSQSILIWRGEIENPLKDLKSQFPVSDYEQLVKLYGENLNVYWVGPNQITSIENIKTLEEILETL